MDTTSIGRRGESLACSFLEKKGYTVLRRNYFVRAAELDIVALQGQSVVFVEVKTWRSLEFTDLERAITPRKMKRIYQAAMQFLVEEHQGLYAQSPYRFDLIYIQLPQKDVVHVQDAFSHWQE